MKKINFIALIRKVIANPQDKALIEQTLQYMVERKKQTQHYMDATEIGKVTYEETSAFIRILKSQFSTFEQLRKAIRAE